MLQKSLLFLGYSKVMASWELISVEKSANISVWVKRCINKANSMTTILICISEGFCQSIIAFGTSANIHVIILTTILICISQGFCKSSIAFGTSASIHVIIFIVVQFVWKKFTRK